MKLSPRIAEQLEDTDDSDLMSVHMTAFPHGLARVLCWMGFHVVDSYHITRETNWIDVQACSRCGRITFMFVAPIDEIQDEDE